MMNYKKVGVLFLLLLMIGSLSAQFVAAAGPLDTIVDIVTLQFVFKNLHIGAAIGPQSIAPLEGFIRFLIFIVLLSLFYEGAKLLPFGSNTRLVLALAFSLMISIFIPGVILLAAATGYTTLFSVVLVGLPFVALVGTFFLLKEYPKLRAVAMVPIVASIWAMEQFVSPTGGLAQYVGTNFQNIFDSVSSLYNYEFWISILLTIVSFFKAFQTIGGATPTRPNWFGTLKDRILQQSAFTEKGKELRHAKREETRLLADIANEKNEMEVLSAAERQGEKYEKTVDYVISVNGIPSKSYLTMVKDDFDRLKEAVKNVNDADHQWKRSRHRAWVEIRRLFAEMINKSVDRKVIADLETIEKKIETNLDQVTASVKTANQRFVEIEDAHTKIVKVASSFYGKNPGATPFNMASPAASSLLTRLKDEIDKLRTALADARDEENEAMNQVAALADDIKKHWVV